MTTEQFNANRVVAEFMGYHSFQGTSAFIKGASYKFVLCYHSNWDELMNVVEKIDSIHELTNGEIYCQTNATSHTFYINYNNGGCISRFKPQCHIGRHRADGETRIENVFWAIVDFLTWCKDNNIHYPQEQNNLTNPSQTT